MPYYIFGQNKILSCQCIVLLVCLPDLKAVLTGALQLVVRAPLVNLEQLRVTNGSTIRTALPLVDGLRYGEIERLQIRKRKPLLKERVRVSWKSRCEQ